MRRLYKYLLVAETSVNSAMAYSLNFLFGSFFFILIIFIFLQLWETMLPENGLLEGYTVNKLVWYYITAELVVLTRSEVFQNLNNEIRGGGIAYQLKKPYNYVLYQLSDGLGQMFVKLMMNLPVGILVGFVYVGKLEDFRWISLPVVTLSVILGILLNFFMDAFIGMTAFWTEDNSAFFWISQKLAFMLGLFLPLEFLPGVIRNAAVYLPFSYIAYAPARLLTAFSSEEFFRIIRVQVFYVLLFMAATCLIYMKGVRRLNVNGG
jgi:ABC-2 type transport system permease protein